MVTYTIPAGYHNGSGKVTVSATYNTQVVTQPLSNPTVQTYTSNVIDCGVAKTCYYVLYSGGGSMEYIATSYVQGSNDNSSWQNHTYFNTGNWGNTYTSSGNSGTIKFRYWRIQTVVTKVSSHCGQMLILYA